MVTGQELDGLGDSFLSPFEHPSNPSEYPNLLVRPLHQGDFFRAKFRGSSGGWTLHQLRHSALTHLAEQNVSLPLLVAKSRHASLRSLQHYARPGAEAVAAMTAATDPARRRNLHRLE
jgi:integrase